MDLGRAEENAKARNDTHHYSDTAADRRAADVGLFKRLGLLSRRWARHHPDHRYYSGLDGTSIAIAHEHRGGQDAPFSCCFGSAFLAFCAARRPAATSANLSKKLTNCCRKYNGSWIRFRLHAVCSRNHRKRALQRLQNCAANHRRADALSDCRWEGGTRLLGRT